MYYVNNQCVKIVFNIKKNHSRMLVLTFKNGLKLYNKMFITLYHLKIF